MNRFVEDADLEVLYYRRITDASVKNKQIESITLEDSQKPDRQTDLRFVPNNLLIVPMKVI